MSADPDSTTLSYPMNLTWHNTVLTHACWVSCIVRMSVGTGNHPLQNARLVENQGDRQKYECKAVLGLEAGTSMAPAL